MIQDAAGEKGGQPLIKQASYYYMGHFSRYLVPGAKRVQVSNTVEVEIPQVTAADIKNGAALLFEPCDAASAVQQFRFATASLIADKIAASLIANGTDDAPGSDGYQRGGECVELCIMPGCWFPKVQLWACGDGGEADHGGRGNQKWDVQSVKGGYKLEVRGSPEGAGGGEVKGCLTAVKAEGWAVDLDAGLEVIAAQLAPCLSDGTSNQTFLLGGDGEGGRCTLERCEEAPLTCPAVHRGGRVAAGEFLHGWDGRCEALPRASDPKAAQRAYRRDRAQWYRKHTGSELTGSIAEQNEQWDNYKRNFRARGTDEGEYDPDFAEYARDCGF
mmetsp:Transcript_41210/g.133627  ORF Transcript_41210/g.133627 Transcript_41210/m.133627 type:complete len:330 (+) Transcript_41210:959-1948(+)